ncbi:alpha/beta hydrolase [uncultured Treponema sp.]|uniref:alpha/beta hydrolase n=1 Tax=uncultured Treponema sp. TaxID=162155 RepID=UPI0026353475|nr:alpha/beta hydrolase [uncultured Treponema sp.]
MKKSFKFLCATALALASLSTAFAKDAKNGVKMEKLKLGKKWDKTFALSDSVSHKKVTFTNHFGITLAADMYTPKTEPSNGKFAAIAVAGPFGAVKEQASGLYAHEMAKRGYLTIAFDPSFTGESGGQPRYMNSPDINTEDFQAAVDFLSNLPNVNPEKIGIIGICGWGGMALNTAGIDTRIKATAVMTMYDMSRIANKGYFDENDNEESRYQARVAVNKARTESFANGNYPTVGGLPENRPEGDTFFSQYWDYYKTGRGYHPRSLNSNMGWASTASTSLMNTSLLTYSNEIRSAVLIVHGEKAHSRYMGETAYNNMVKDSKYTANKELMIIPEATHCDLYDGGKGNFIPWEKLQGFFEANLK